jgi:hypothetical protein
MADSKKLITKVSRLHNARQLIESITEPANSAYYVFIGNHLDYANTSAIPQPNDSVYETHIDVYRNMIYGKRITQNDVKLMIERNDYQSNTVYSMYDDRIGESDIAFFDSNYYAVVNAGAFYHVFKVLDNNGGVPSTVQPEFSEIDTADEIYQTSDGYNWKYMYSVDDTTVRKFATTEYFPVVANNQVSSAAKEGIINVIRVENGGRGYDNYCNGTFRTEDLRIAGNSQIYSINASQTANNTSKFYNGCYLYIAAGTGAGQYSKINDYVVNSTVKAIYLQSEFTTPPLIDSVFEIFPGVEIVGDGTETIKAEARAIVNSSGNSIQRVEMLNLGEDYKFATAKVLADDVVGITNTAIIRPVYSPPNGHGYDAAAELGATRLCISTKFSNTDIEIPLTNEYRTIGLLKDPMFSNVVMNFTEANGTFVSDEKVYKVNGVRINDNASISSTDSIVTADADFTNQVEPGEYIYFKTDLGYQLAVVNSVVNSSYITTTQNNFYSCTATSIYKTDIVSSISNVALSTSVLTGNVSVNTTSANIVGTGTSFTSQLVANSSHVFVYGNSSGGGQIKKVISVANDTHAVLDSNCSFANATAKGQVINYTITPETIAGVGSTEGYVTSVSVGTLFTSNVKGIFKTGDFIIGERSGATGTISTISRNDTNKGFDNFVQMYKYTVSSVVGTFEPDELVFQSLTGLSAQQFANAYLHSIVDDGVTIEYFVTNQTGVFNSGNNIIGSESSATANVVNKYSPELEFGSGDVLYIEKIDSINRSNTATEIIKLIFEF